MKNLLISLFIIFCFNLYSQKVIKLYNGEIPKGNEILNKEESIRYDSNGNIVTIRNVKIPNLTIFEPDPKKKNGIALIICPGGGFQGLAYQHEGEATAKWCIQNGITAFVLKYRLMPYPFPKIQNATNEERNELFKPFVKLALEDGLEAIRYVRNNALKYNLDSNMIGILGYSAGGTIVGSVAKLYDKNSRPDFVGLIYPYVGAILGDKVLENAPPIFITSAADDTISNNNYKLFEEWTSEKKIAEIHTFQNGGHGFSVLKQNRLSDLWPNLFLNWLINLKNSQLASKPN